MALCGLCSQEAQDGHHECEVTEQVDPSKEIVLNVRIVLREAYVKVWDGRFSQGASSAGEEALIIEGVGQELGFLLTSGWAKVHSYEPGEE